MTKRSQSPRTATISTAWVAVSRLDAATRLEMWSLKYERLDLSRTATDRILRERRRFLSAIDDYSHVGIGRAPGGGELVYFALYDLQTGVGGDPTLHRVVMGANYKRAGVRVRGRHAHLALRLLRSICLRPRRSRVHFIAQVSLAGYAAVIRALEPLTKVQFLDDPDVSDELVASMRTLGDTPVLRYPAPLMLDRQEAMRCVSVAHWAQFMARIPDPAGADSDKTAIVGAELSLRQVMLLLWHSATARFFPAPSIQSTTISPGISRRSSRNPSPDRVHPA